jgi:uncharacterized membrane protein
VQPIMTSNKLEDLFDTENIQLEKLNEIVQKTIEEEKFISDKLLEFEDKKISFSSKVADKVSAFGGSWRFIISFGLFMIIWMTANIYLLSRPFDPFPFILLNLILSAIASVQAPVIMMSQNRKEEKDRQRSVNDYMVKTGPADD